MSIISNIKEEIEYISKMAKTSKLIEDLGPFSNHFLADDWEAICDSHKNKIAIIFEDQKLTYEQFDMLANQYANWALAKGLKAGDSIAIFMNNCPDYIAAWYGFSKIGVIGALINQSLIGEQLIRSVIAANTKILIVDGELLGEWERVDNSLHNIEVFVLSKNVEAHNDLRKELNSQSTKRPNRSYRAQLLGKSPAMYLYTSGTTGFPKAAIISQSRVMGMSRVFMAGTEANENDIIYISLPLYHGTGGVCAVGLAFNKGGTIFLKKKFSAKSFWSDIVENKCTIFVYIGELLRYLINQPPDEIETKHNLKSCFGNGLRLDVWERADKRFKIPKIIEFYGSTEGNVFLVNVTGHKGAIGRLPKYLNGKINIDLVKFDIDSEMPIRGADGLCQRCEALEIGEAIGKLDKNDPKGQFDGYANDKGATEKKILRDVFIKGDAYFRTGDLMKQDKSGYFYFIDRIGDTYRWKSENVSTAVVSEVIGNCENVQEVNVYGVSIPYHEGKAGMAVISADVLLDFENIYKKLKSELPHFAIPVFLRIKDKIETTGTFKYTKRDLVSEGYNINIVSDPIYWLDIKDGKYNIMNIDNYDNIMSGKLRF